MIPLINRLQPAFPLVVATQDWHPAGHLSFAANHPGKKEYDVIELAERNDHNWRAAVAESGLDADAYLYRDRSADGFLPWHIIDGGAKTTFFRQELEKSQRAETTLEKVRG